MKKLIYLSFIVSILASAFVYAKSEPDFRLVVTGGLQGIRIGSEEFYNSPIFRLGIKSPITITNAHLDAYTDGQVVYWKKNNRFPTETSTFSAISAPQFFGIHLREGRRIANFYPEHLKRELGGSSVQSYFSAGKIGSQDFYAFSPSQKINWPSHLAKLHKLSAVFAQNAQGDSYYFFPRDFRSTRKTFELVDKLLKKPGHVRYIDLGNALSSGNEENDSIASQMATLLEKRNPAALSLGRYDLSVLLKIPKDSAYIGALTGTGAPPTAREVQIGNSLVQFLALGPISNLATGFLQPNLQPINTRESIESVKHNLKDIVVALTENRSAANEAIEYPMLDLVLVLSSLRGGLLPSFDQFELENEHIRSVAPLVRISPAEVTEISIWLKNPNQIQRIAVDRHPILGDFSTQDQFYEPVLKAQNWSDKQFEDMLSNVLLNTYPHAEIAIMENRLVPTPIDSGLPMSLAQHLIAPAGRAVEIDLGGYYVKKILKAIKNKQFGLDVVVANMIERNILASESYKIVVTEKVLVAISDFLAHAELFVSTQTPSNSLQSALAESNKDAIKLLQELRKRENKQSISLHDTHALLLIAPSLGQLVQDAVQNRTIDQKPDRSILVFDVSDLDFGIKANLINETLSIWQDQANKPNSNATFDENRFWDSRMLNVLLYTKIGLHYYMPRLETGITGSIKYYQPNTEPNPFPANFDAKDIQKIRPAKDSVRVDADLRFPIDWPASPLARLTYETQMWPNTLVTNLPESKWPRRVHDMRLFLGMSRKPLLGHELFRVGALLGYDFSRSSPKQSFGAGFELGGAYQYSWKYVGFKIGSDFRKLFPIVSDPDIGRMGIVWLTDAKIEVPIYAGFSLSAMANFTVGERMAEPWNFGTGIVLGLALSYGNRLKWLL